MREIDMKYFFGDIGLLVFGFFDGCVASRLIVGNMISGAQKRNHSTCEFLKETYSMIDIANEEIVAVAGANCCYPQVLPSAIKQTAFACSAQSGMSSCPASPLAQPLGQPWAQAMCQAWGQAWAQSWGGASASYYWQ